MLLKYAPFLFICLYCQLSAQTYIANVPQAFAAVNDKPYTYTCASKQAGAKGGHLQGVQMVHNAREEFIITASGGENAYYVYLYQGKAVYTKQILEMPYRHAGGCQAAGNLLVVGVEDNMAKDKSKVLLLSTDTNTPPMVIAERKGKYERSTAGATALVQLKDGRYLVAVGDWDSRNVDFYMSKTTNAAVFDSVNTYKVDTIGTWGSYQSVNLLQQADGKLYMIGFCLDNKGCRADLFSINMEGRVSMHAVASRYFKTTKGISFRYGAGLHISNNKLTLIACNRILKRGMNYLNFWQ